VPGVLPPGAPVPADGALPASAAAELGRQPFGFYITGAALYLVLTTLTGAAFRGAERRFSRGVVA